MAPVSSPCIGVCTIDPSRGLCLGCWRSIDDIVGWGGFSEPRRLAVMAVLAERRDVRGPAAAPAPTADPPT